MWTIIAFQKWFFFKTKKVLPHPIHSDQKAYISGRQISENIRLTKDIEEYEIEGAIIILDLEKAFDLVEWEYPIFIPGAVPKMA